MRTIAIMNNKGRSPYGERGLKLDALKPYMAHIASLPLRGAWIEINKSALKSQAINGRSPYGERGLKSYLRLRSHHLQLSLPLRGAWIEM